MLAGSGRRAGAGGGCGARGAGDHAGCWEQSSWLPAQTLSGGGGRWGHRRFARLAPMTRRRAVDAANGGQWPPRRGEEQPRALTQHAAGPRCVPNGPPGCRGERGMARAAATLGIIGLRWPPRAPPNMLSFAVVTEWPVGVYPPRRRRSPPHARIVRAVDLPTPARVCVFVWAK